MRGCPLLSRRALGAGLLGASLAAPPLARAQQRRQLSVVVSAIYRRSFEQFVIPRMRQEHNVEVSASSLLSAEALSRAIAQRANPQISLFTLDEGPWMQGRDLNLWAQLPPAAVTALADIDPKYRDAQDRGAALFNYFTGFVYDEDALRAANVAVPSSFWDMWGEGFRNRMALPQFTNTFAFITLAHATRLAGGDPAVSFDPGFQRMRALSPNVRTFIGPLGQLIQLFQQKEAWLAFAPQLSALQAAAAGLPIRWAEPREGAVAVSHYLAIPANAPNSEDAQRLANLMLGPEYQKAIAEIDFMVPVNRRTQLSSEFQASFPVKPEMIGRAHQIPWAEYNRRRVQLGERWQREVQG